nr:hypothetical protein L203_04549 [Cryptococcus depauperatus CBS 7841]
MDQDHAPRSPLQRPHSSRHGGTSQEGSDGQRPPNGLYSSPTVGVNPLPGWAAEEDDESQIWRAQSGSWKSQEEPKKVKPAGVCIDIRTPMVSPDSCKRFEGYNEGEGRTLLTSTPLDRIPQPSTASMTRHVGKRSRSHSVPPMGPYKRHKLAHTTSLSLSSHADSGLPPSTSQSSMSGSREGGIKLIHCVVAGRTPSINVHSLKALDASEILKNRQLRHDLLFDALAFRPVTVSHRHGVKGGRYAGVIATTSVPTVDPSASDVVTDLYWESINGEVSHGCRCTRWALPEGKEQLDAETLSGLKRVYKCLCGRWKPELSEKEWWKNTSTWPSRLPDLIQTLREILLALMGSTTPCPNHFAHSFSQEALDAHESTCPTVTHVLVPQLTAALDPEFLTMQVRRGTFDTGLFQQLGEAMKVHCAPVRDAMIDAMIQMAKRGKITEALRMCFDCAEVMKLDIANHQVHSLRPYLWQYAGLQEYSSFEEGLRIKGRDLSTSSTRLWIYNASLRVLKTSEPHERNHMIGKCICRDTTELATRSLVEGFLGLVFTYKIPDGSNWPPITNRHKSQTDPTLYEEDLCAPMFTPEVFRMDGKRIRDFYAICVDMAISHSIMLAIRHIYTQCTGKSHSDIPEAAIQAARCDIDYMLDELSTLSNSTQSDIRRAELYEDLSYRLAFRILHPNVNQGDFKVPPTEEGQVVVRAACMFYNFLNEHLKRDSTRIQAHMAIIRKVLYKVLTDVFLSYRFNSKSPFYNANADKCKRKHVTTGDGDASSSGGEFCFESNKAERETTARHQACLQKFQEEELALILKFGLEGVVGPIKEVTERMVKLLAFNLSVFALMYKSKGMLVGSGEPEDIQARPGERVYLPPNLKAQVLQMSQRAVPLSSVF